MNITKKNLENMERLLNIGAWPSKSDFLDVVQFAKKVVLDSNVQVAMVRQQQKEEQDK